MRCRKRFNRPPVAGDVFTFAHNFNQTPRTVTAVGRRNFLYELHGSEYIGHLAEFIVNAVELCDG